MSLEYRSCVVGVFVNDRGQILAGERSDCPGAWQLPQGGVEPGESVIKALYREMKEEVGCSLFEIVDQAPRAIKYRFPDDLNSKLGKKYCGQSTTWFLLKFNKGSHADLKQADGEFRDIKWMYPADLLSGIIAFKKEAYSEGLRMLRLEK